MNTILKIQPEGAFSPKRAKTKKKRPPYFVYKPRCGFGLYLGYPQKTTLSTEV